MTIAKAELAERLARHGLRQVLHNLPAGDWAAGERGIACLPDRVGEFQDGVGHAIDYAKALGCPQMNCLAGIPPPAPRATPTRVTLVANLRFAARELSARASGCSSSRSTPTTSPASHLTAASGARRDRRGRVRQPRACNTTSTTCSAWRANSPRRCAQHSAHRPHPARRQPGPPRAGHGRNQLRLSCSPARRVGYDGWIGCEYKPRDDDRRRPRLAARSRLRPLRALA